MNRSIFLSYSVLGNNILVYLGRLKELEHTPSPPPLILYKNSWSFFPNSSHCRREEKQKM
jgi:hypothetical protein